MASLPYVSMVYFSLSAMVWMASSRADSLELAFAALADALHRIQQAVGAVQPTTHRTAAQAGTRLEVDIARVIGLHVPDLAVFDMPLEHAVAAAVDVALAPRDRLFGGFVGAAASSLFGAQPNMEAPPSAPAPTTAPAKVPFTKLRRETGCPSISFTMIPPLIKDHSLKRCDTNIRKTPGESITPHM